jgi:predicted tellurium resistance membrane protein TerC
MDWLTNPEIWAALLTLTALEIVLGVDNIIFLSIIVSKLPAHEQNSARLLGLAGAMITRIGLLFSLTWLARLTEPLFSVIGYELSGRDLVLIVGGLFLFWKATTEIGEQMELPSHDEDAIRVRAVTSYFAAIVQIMLIDIVFSLDSVITAVGMTNNLPVMVAAIVIAVLTMMVASGPLARFVDRHPTIKVLALAFLLLVGMALVGEGLDFHIPKGYIYFAMAFSVGVETVNLRVRAKNAATRTPLPPAGDSSGV